jgi:hypothetical protein
MYRLITFGTTTLEYYNQVDSIGSGETPSQYQTLAEGGALDLFGSQQKHPGVVEYTKSLRLKAATPTALTSLYLGLLQLRGKRDLLYRKTVGSNLTHWKYARLVQVNAARDYDQAKFKLIQDMDMRFEAQDAFWNGTAVGWRLDTGAFLNAGLSFDTGNSQTLSTSPKTFTLTLGSASDAGRAPTRAIIMTINPGNAPMSAITITRTGGESIQYTGTLAAGEILVIDTGSMQVTRAGVDAYSNLVLSPTADLATWFTLQPGANDMTVTWTGGGAGAEIDFVYYEAWY